VSSNLLNLIKKNKNNNNSQIKFFQILIFRKKHVARNPRFDRERHWADIWDVEDIGQTLGDIGQTLGTLHKHLAGIWQTLGGHRADMKTKKKKSSY
jgi:hypothetical protein